MYDEVIDAVIESLPQNTADARRPVYRQLRVELANELASIDPPLHWRDLLERRQALEKAIIMRERKELAALTGITEASPR